MQFTLYKIIYQPGVSLIGQNLCTSQGDQGYKSCHKQDYPLPMLQPPMYQQKKTLYQQSQVEHMFCDES